MYQYLYQDLLPEGAPLFSCIVPVEWLKKKLPTMGGCVNYAANREQLSVCAGHVYSFFDVKSTDKLTRIVSLEIHDQGVKKFDIPAKIYCPNFEEENDEWCTEIVLLNHFFGFCIPAVNYLDYSDVLAQLVMSSEFDFRYGIGDAPSDIFPGILPVDAKSAFGVIFCNREKMKFSYLDDSVEAMEQACTEDGRALITDVGVNQGQMLISVLYGR